MAIVKADLKMKYYMVLIFVGILIFIFFFHYVYKIDSCMLWSFIATPTYFSHFRLVGILGANQMLSYNC